ncbi:hypothetical protein EZZ76_04510 [Neisseria meningitidis]|nr:hypothetical protein [Neisseria meningitidis]
MKIFWLIFMRQISLTDYFCKGLGLNKMPSEPFSKRSDGISSIGNDGDRVAVIVNTQSANISWINFKPVRRCLALAQRERFFNK